MGNALFIFKLANFLYGEFPALITDAEKNLILSGSDDFVYGRPDVQQNEPVSFPRIIDNINKLVFVFRHRKAAVFREIKKTVNLLVPLSIDSLHLAGLVADSDDNGSSLRICVGTHNIRQIRRPYPSGYLLSWTLAFAVFCVVVVRIIRALRRGEMFPRSNVRRIFVIAGLLAAGIFFSSNVGNVMHGRNLVTIDTGSFFWPILCIIFALLYRQAAMAAEDSRLTI